MAKLKNLKWNGEAIKRRIRSDEIAAVDRTMSECVIHAKRNHSFVNRTGVLEGGIRIVNFATPHNRGVRGVWGVADVVYARRIEEGFKGTDKKGRTYDQEARPFLRPAADAIYPKLADFIKEEHEKKNAAAGASEGGE